MTPKTILIRILREKFLESEKCSAAINREIFSLAITYKRDPDSDNYMDPDSRGQSILGKYGLRLQAPNKRDPDPGFYHIMDLGGGKV